MAMTSHKERPADARQREEAALLPVYPQLPLVPQSADGCDIVTQDGRRILDLYGGHAVAALGYSHPVLLRAIREQSEQLLFQSNAVALDIRARAAEKLLAVAPANLARVFFANSGGEANENALRIACMATGRRKVLALTQGFHGRTAAAAAVTWNSSKRWYGFPQLPFDVDFIARDDVDAALRMIDDDVAAVIFEPIQGVAGAYDLSADFVAALRHKTRDVGAVLIADEVQSGMGRSGRFFAVQHYGVEADILTNAKSLAGGFPCAALLCSEPLAATLRHGDLGSTFGGGPMAAAAIVAVIDTLQQENLLQNVREREAEIRARCIAGPVQSISGKGMLLGLHCDRRAADVQALLLEQDILTGVSGDPAVLRLLPPLILQTEQVTRLADALAGIAPQNNQ